MLIHSNRFGIVVMTSKKRDPTFPETKMQIGYILNQAGPGNIKTSL